MIGKLKMKFYKFFFNIVEMDEDELSEEEEHDDEE